MPRQRPKSSEVSEHQEAVELHGAGAIRSGRLAGLSMNRAIFVLSWPILVDSLLNSLVGMTDTVLAANLENGSAATDAIGGASYIMWFIGLVLMAVDVGVTALISRAVGAGRMAVANAAVGQAMLLGVISGAITGALVFVAAPALARVMNLSPDATTAFITYMHITAAGAPLAAILFAGIACCRGAGDSLRPLIAMAAVNAVNMVVSWALAGADLKKTVVAADGSHTTRILLANPFDFDLGVRGIALGTVIAHAVGAAFLIVILARGTGASGPSGNTSHGVRLLAKRLKPHAHTMKRLVRVGIPNFLETSGMWAGNFLLVLMVGWLSIRHGPGILGAHIVTIRIESFSYLPGFAMGAAAATLAGQYLGAGRPDLARRAVWRCTLVTLVFMGATGILFLTIPERLVGIFTSQDVHLQMVPQALFIAGLIQIPFGLSIVLRSALRGAGDVRAVMWLTWLTTYGFRLPLAYACSGVDIPLPAWLPLGGPDGVLDNPFTIDQWAGGPLAGLWLGMCAELVVRALLFGWRFWHGGWMKTRV